MSSRVTIVNKPTFFNELTEAVRRTGLDDSVALSTMIFHPANPDIATLLDELYEASIRGAKITLNLDAFVFLIRYGMQPGPLYFTKNETRWAFGEFKSRLNHINKLRAAGITCTIINRPLQSFKNPFSGRSHIKYAAVNDLIYIGGCNFDATNQIDFMARMQNKEAARWLHEMTTRIAESGSVVGALGLNDISYRLNDTDTVFVDVGVKGQSIIYDAATRMIRDAKREILITSQFFPLSKTAHLLKDAEARGVAVKIIFNHPSRREHGITANLLHKIFIRRERKHIPHNLFQNMLPKDHAFLHAKIFIADNECLVGSHNYLDAGVRLGTAEIALHSLDRQLIAQLQHSLKQSLTTPHS